MSSKGKGVKRKATEAPELNAKKAKGETSLGDELKWSYHGEVIKGTCPLMLLSSDTLPGRPKAVGLDIDFTVIKTKSGSKFATGASDWEWWDACVPDKLRQLHRDGYRVIFYTNQAGIEKKKVNPDDLTSKIEAIIDELGIPVLAFVCTGENHFRKPSTMMWDHWEQNCNQGVEVNRSDCLFIGDAAGRAKSWAPGKPKDFSCSDRMFAANLDVKFKTPEEFFLGEKPAAFSWGAKDPSEFVSNKAAAKIKYRSDSAEMVIMVGAPATGKTTFRKRYLEPHGYVAVNKDTMGTINKCIKAATEALKSGKSVVADNTNSSKAARKDFIDCAKKAGVTYRCFVMNTPLEIAHHLNYVRQNQTNGGVKRIPDIGYHMYKKNFEAPDKSEGFSDILTIDFESKFDDKRHEELFRQWT